MRLRVLLLLWGLFVLQSIQAQIVLVPEIPQSGIIMRQQLYSVLINNLTGQQIKAMLMISVADRNISQPLMEANSGILVLPPGAKRIMYNDLAPVSYLLAAPGYGMEARLNQPLPVGEYLVCYRLVDAGGKNQVLANECVKVVSEPLSPPQLIQPENESAVMDAKPVLTWTPPAPVTMFNTLLYNVVVSPVYEKQSPQEAIQRNQPVLVTQATVNSMLYPAGYTNLLPGKTYAWQVGATDAGRFGAKSEVFTFTIVPDSVKAIIASAAFVKIQGQPSEVTYLQQGILKLDYSNYAGDSTVKVLIEDMSEPSTRKISFDLRVTAGQNMIQKDINKLGRFNPDHLYKLTIINSRKEPAYFRFSAKYYF